MTVARHHPSAEARVESIRCLTPPIRQPNEAVMTPELLSLNLAALLQFVQIALYATPASLERVVGCASMTPELTALTLAALLQTVQYFLFAIPANRDLGMGYTSSARDRPPSRQLSIFAGRMQRAFANHFEGLILFTIAVLVVTLANQSTQTTQFAAYTYLAARALYVPAYAFGWRPWRSVIWAVGYFATLTMLVAALI